MVKYFSSCILLCLFLTVVHCQREKTVCEHQQLNLRCGKKGVIEIQSSFYGRVSDQICTSHPSHGVPSGGCSASSALSVTKTACDGKRTCTIQASNSVFGDPCVGTFKYMTVKWKCVKANEDTVCEHEYLDIECGKDKVVEIISSFYGRVSDKICTSHPSHGVPSGGCSASSALSVTKTTCDGRPSCRVYASNSVFGDPCVGTFKYMTVKWKCVKASHKTVCEHQNLNINCGRNKIIDIRSSFYGRVSDKICTSHPSHGVPSGGCSASSALSVTKNTCDGRHSCNVPASNRVFGDPCVGTFKYLSVSWDCIRANYQTSCEGTNLQISCPGSKVITIHSAFYGRRSDNVCGSWTVPRGGCSSPAALPIVQDLCDDETTCTIGVNNGLFGDPCHGTYKYMTVSWTCK